MDIKSPYRVGKYKVDIKGLEDFLDTISCFDHLAGLMIIDEIGKMECLSDKFKRFLKEILDSEKWVIATIALKGSGLIADVKQRHDVRLFEMTQSNRDTLLLEILSSGFEIRNKFAGRG
jgi:nucleoside-triphosphatase